MCVLNQFNDVKLRREKIFMICRIRSWSLSLTYLNGAVKYYWAFLKIILSERLILVSESIFCHMMSHLNIN